VFQFFFSPPEGGTLQLLKILNFTKPLEKFCKKLREKKIM
jgi:hypothetical protein